MSGWQDAPTVDGGGSAAPSWQSAPTVQPDDNRPGGGVNNFLGGLNESIANIAGAPVDAMNWLGSHNPTNMAVNAGARLFGAKQDVMPDMPAVKEPFMGSDYIKNKIFRPVGVRTMKDVKTETIADRLAAGAGQGLGGALIPGGEASLPGIAANMGVNTAAGLGAAGAQEAAPDNLKPLAGMIGGLAGGVGVSTLSTVPGRLARTATRASVPFAAAASENAAQRAAGTILRQNATNPKTVAEMLAQGTKELLPGSQPTTFQQTGDMGLGALERGVSTQHPDLFQARRAEQNTARLSTLDTLQSGGNAADVAQAFRNQLDDLDTQTADHAHQLLTAAQAKAQALGGAGTPEHYGDALRTVVRDADDASRAREGELWKAVDPNGDLTGNVSATRSAAKDIAGEVSKYAKPMTGEEAGIFEVAQQMKAVEPVADLIALRSRVSTEMRNELASNGRSPSYARLTRLRGAIQDNLSHSIAQQAVRDDALAAKGAMPQGETLANRLEQWANEHKQRTDAAAASRASTGGVPGEGTPADTGANGTGVPAAGGLGSATGDQGLPAGPGPEPSLNELVSARAAVDFSRSKPVREPSLLQTVKNMGGIKLKGASGEDVPGAAEIRAVMKDVRIPGLINNKAGRTPDYLRESLAESGWFGHAAGEDMQHTDLNDLYDLLGQEAHGEKIYHPLSDVPADMRARELHDQEMAAAGVASGDTVSQAAHKLALFRRGPRADRLADAQERKIDQDLGQELTLDEFERLHGDYGYEPGSDVGAELGASRGAPEIGGGQVAISEGAPGGTGGSEQTAGGGPLPQEPASVEPLRSGITPASIQAEHDAEIASINRQGIQAADEATMPQALRPVPPATGEQPTFDAAAAERLKTATAATREQRGTFARGPVGQVLATAGMKDIFRLPEARVPEKFFHPGPTGFTDAHALIKAIGEDKAIPLLADYAASSLRKAALREDGALDPAKFSRWHAANADSLRALPPEIRGAFSNAAKATQALDEAAVARVAALKDMRAGALGHLMGATSPEDATRHIASIFGTKESVALIKKIARTVENDPAAKAGLRQAVADHIASKFISNTEAAASGQNLIKSDMFQTFLKNNRTALAQVFKPEEMSNLQRIADDLHQANRSVTAVKLPGGSNTAQDLYSAGKYGADVSRLQKIISAAKISGAGAGAGFLGGGPMGAMIGAIGAPAVQAMREVGLTRIDQLVTQAMLDPELALKLLQKAPIRETEASTGALARAIRRSFAGAAAQTLGTMNRSSASQPSPAKNTEARAMPKAGVLPGTLHLDSTIAPHVPPGAPRPFAPGEWVQNPNGSWSSEISVTVTDPRLNGGRATNLPSLWIVDGKPVRVSEDRAADYALQSKLRWPSYANVKEADAAATRREDRWQNLTPKIARKVAPLWTVTSSLPRMSELRGSQ